MPNHAFGDTKRARRSWKRTGSEPNDTDPASITHPTPPSPLRWRREHVGSRTALAANTADLRQLWRLECGCEVRCGNQQHECAISQRNNAGDILRDDRIHAERDLHSLVMNPGANPLNFLAGDPVLNWADSHTFYYSQLFETGTLVPFAPQTAIAMSKSTDRGATWGDPIPAVQKDCMSLTRISIFRVPYAASQRRSFPTNRLALSSYVPLTAESPGVPPSPSTRSVAVLRISPLCRARRSPWARMVKCTSNGSCSRRFPTGDRFALQGLFRTWLTGNLAIDLSTMTSAGTLYFIWEDGRFLRLPDLESPNGQY